MIRIDSRPSPASTAIAVVAAALLGLGVVMVLSASASLTARPVTERPFSNPVWRQASFSFAALIMMLMVGLCPYESWRIRRRSWFQPAVFLSVITLALLAAVLVPGIGDARHGARRWISLGPAAAGLGFQPSELAKPAMVILLAGLCSRMGERVRHFFTGLLPLLLIIAAAGGLVGVEDFGTAVLLFVVGGCVLLGAGAKLWHLIVCSLPAAVGFAYLAISKPYRVERLVSFLDPFADAQGRGYHQVQSLITIASGGWWGRGVGAGIQKYGYLPEGRSDFVFAVICEELGIIGGIAVLGLFAVLLWGGRRAMLNAGTEFGRLLALGISLTVGFQAAMNVAVVTVSVPPKGIGLPLVSAGGTGVILFGLLLGLLINVARDRSHRPAVEALPDICRMTAPPQSDRTPRHAPLAPSL